MKMHISIDKKAGFCSGVKKAIRKAEEALVQHGSLYCLGQIVHNEAEESRLQTLGLQVINPEQMKQLHNTRVLIRAHGEPPETYRIAAENNLTLIDATCPVVLRLQQKIKKSFETGKATQAQVVIYGRKNHPEVIGLNGQIRNKALVIEGPEEIDKIDLSRPVSLFAQTTKNKNTYQEIIQRIEAEKGKVMIGGELHFTSNNSICAQVSNRDAHLRDFAGANDLLIFVAGKNSSNGKYLYSVCRDANPNTFMVSSPGELEPAWFSPGQKVGVSGATSTPEWLLEAVAAKISTFKYPNIW